MNHRGLAPPLLVVALAGTVVVSPSRTATAAEWRASLPAACAQVAVDGSDGAYASGSTGDWRISKLDLATGAEDWTQVVEVLPPQSSGVLALEVLQGDVLATGSVPDGPGFRISVKRLAAATGSLVWEYSATDAGGHALATLAGDVVVAGTARVGGVRGAVVVRIDGATAAEIWRTDVQEGTDATFSYVATDPSGNVVAAGNAGPQRALVVKLDGATGTELWRYAVPGLRGVRSIAVDGAGHVLAGTWGFDVVKLDRDTGAVLWTASLDGSSANQVQEGAYGLVATAGGDAVVAGVLDDHRTSHDIAVVRLDGASGAIVWQYDWAYGHLADEALDAAIDSSGDLHVTGFVTRQDGTRKLVVLKLDGENGTALWRHVLEGYPDDGIGMGRAVDLDADGNPYVCGLEGARHVLALDGETGILGSVHGRKIKMSDVQGLPERRSLTVILNDTTLTVPDPGSADDPTIAGATVRLVNPVTAESATFSLPGGAHWKGLGTPPGARGYKYSDKAATAGPCRSLKAIAGKIFQVSCRAKSAPIPFSLDEPSQGTLILSVQLGGAPAQCGRFGGKIGADTGIAHPSPVGRFLATSAQPLGHCP